MNLLTLLLDLVWRGWFLIGLCYWATQCAFGHSRVCWDMWQEGCPKLTKYQNDPTQTTADARTWLIFFPWGELLWGTVQIMCYHRVWWKCCNFLEYGGTPNVERPSWELLMHWQLWPTIPTMFLHHLLLHEIWPIKATSSYLHHVLSAQYWSDMLHGVPLLGLYTYHTRITFLQKFSVLICLPAILLFNYRFLKELNRISVSVSSSKVLCSFSQDFFTKGSPEKQSLRMQMNLWLDCLDQHLNSGLSFWFYRILYVWPEASYAASLCCNFSSWKWEE